MPHDFKQMRLGHAAAEEERTSDPDLLLHGFLDPFGAMPDLRSGRKFLVLGPKGSGKSAIAQRLSLEATGNPMLFAESLSLGDFPFSAFSSLVPGDDAQETKLNVAWRWVMLVQAFGSLSKDSQATHPAADSWHDVQALLTKRGLLAAPDVRTAVARSRSNNMSVEATLPFLPLKIAWSSGEAAIPPDVAVMEMVETLVSSVKTPANHYVVIDGLDDLLSDGNLHLQTVSSLVTQAYRLNRQFEECKVPLKIVVLCRTDLYDRLPDANTTKIRRDRSVELDWYRNPRDISESMLLKVVALRAKLSFGREVDIFQEFFPKVLEGSDARTWLLELTRHTPRDFLQLLSCIQAHWRGTRLSRDEVLVGARDYSYQYFLPEIRDHLHGFVTNEAEREMMDLLGSLRRRSFTKEEFMRHAGKQGAVVSGPVVIAFFRALFEAGGIGNIRHVGEGQNAYFTWSFRNRHSTLDMASELILHRGAWKALGLI